MNTCEICFNRTPETYLRANQKVCKECRQWIDRWVAMTPEQQRQELRMMDRYAGEGA